MKTQIAKWGNSMAVRIPKAVAQAAKLLPGDYLELAAEGSGVVRMRKRKEKQTLQDLVRGITAANLHKETDWGVPEGNELW
jgi:antitoxin MazE